MHKQKITFIPGWMRTVKYYKKYFGLDIWSQKISLKKKVNTDYIISHSIGSFFALSNWDLNKNTNLILVNPLLPDRKYIDWIFRWLKYMLSEKIDYDKNMNILNIFHSVKEFFSLSSINLMKVIKKIPKNKIIVIRGMDDKYFCDKESVKILKENKIKVLEVKGAGHSWDKKFDGVIKKITSKT